MLSALQFAGFRLRCAHAVRANLLKLRAEVVKEGEEKGKRGPDAAAATADASLLVLRGGAWRGVSKAALVPGDVMALRSRAGQRGYSEAPADCLVLWGQAVVDEAILTGESLPQLKGPPSVALGEEEEGGRLDMEGQHRPHILFSGTRIVRVEKQDSVGNASVDSFPPLPAGDGEGGEAWLLARVLRTGYFSTQVRGQMWIRLVG